MSFAGNKGEIQYVPRYLLLHHAEVSELGLATLLSLRLAPTKLLLAKCNLRPTYCKVFYYIVAVLSLLCAMIDQTETHHHYGLPSQKLTDPHSAFTAVPRLDSSLYGALCHSRLDPYECSMHLQNFGPLYFQTSKNSKVAH